MTAEKGAVALGYIAGAWALFRAIDGTVQLYVQPWLETTESKVDDVLVPIVIRVTKVIVGLFALLMALETFGMRVEPITSFLLQLGALLVAVAAVSAIWLLRSVVGGLLILFEKPFAEGDRIACGAHTGVIESIAIHQSILKMDDGIRVAIPNHEFVVNRVSLLKVAPKKESKVVEDVPVKGKRAPASEARP
jgi:MscS family membrane protein